MRQLKQLSAHFVFSVLLVCISCDLEEVADACEGEDIQSLASINNISEDCKEAINGLLPSPQDNLTSNLARIGYDSRGDFVQLFFVVSDQNGPIPNLDLTELSIEQSIDGSSVPITISTEDISDASEESISFATVLDYSGSMSQSDIENSAEVLRNVLTLTDFSGRIEANHIAFSTNVDEIATHTEDINALSNELVFQENYERGGTAFYDGLAAGLISLVDRSPAIRVMINISDGKENSSTRYDYDQVVSLASANRIFIVSVGFLLSDLDVFRRLSQDTEGYFVYARKASELNEQMSKLGSLLSTGIKSVRVPRNNADSIHVSYMGNTITYQLGGG